MHTRPFHYHFFNHTSTIICHRTKPTMLFTFLSTYFRFSTNRINISVISRSYTRVPFFLFCYSEKCKESITHDSLKFPAATFLGMYACICMLVYSGEPLTPILHINALATTTAYQHEYLINMNMLSTVCVLMAYMCVCI